MRKNAKKRVSIVPIGLERLGVLALSVGQCWPTTMTKALLGERLVSRVWFAVFYEVQFMYCVCYNNIVNEQLQMGATFGMVLFNNGPLQLSN